MNVLLYQLDGATEAGTPNLALMRIAAHHRALGDTVTLRRVGNVKAIERRVWEAPPDLVYASLLFTKTRPLAEHVLSLFPNAIIGGTGWDLTVTLEQYGITTRECDYTIYPEFEPSVGFTQRGFRFKCPFCVVPRKEGSVREEQSIAEIWRGDPWPRKVLLLDNDFFGQPRWRDRIDELKAGRFKVSFNQGINARTLNDETAAAIASVRYCDDSFTRRRIYTAWDNSDHEGPLFRGLEALVRHGVKPDHVMVYMLIGYWPGETREGWEYRRARLREFGARPYPMPFNRTAEEVGFQRWVVRALDKRVSWEEFERAKYQPCNLGLMPEAPPEPPRSLPLFDAAAEFP